MDLTHVRPGTIALIAVSALLVLSVGGQIALDVSGARVDPVIADVIRALVASLSVIVTGKAVKLDQHMGRSGDDVHQ